jgi:hypothetical protein
MSQQPPKSANSANSDGLYPQTPIQPTVVWFVQGKENNKAFRTALSLHRENATLNPESANVEEAYPQHVKPKET